MTSLRLVLAHALVLTQGCATATSEVSGPDPVGPDPTPIVVAPPPTPALPASPPPAAAPPPAPVCTMFVKPGVVRRAALVRLIDAGMSRWLQGVEGDRVLAKHRFQGWVIKSLHRSDPCYQQIDLRPGDVVQKVNGKSVEKPEQAFEVFESARTAPAIVIDYLRDGKPRQLSLTVSDGK